MKTAKKITAAVLALCTLALILASCGAKPPEEEATTGTEIHSMLDPLGIGETKETGKDKEKNSTAKNDETGSVADTENAEPGETAESESVTAPDAVTGEKETEKTEDSKNDAARVADVEFVLKSYYTDGVNYGEIKNIRFDDEAFASTAYGYLDVNMTYVGSRSKNLIIHYRAYNEAGSVIRNSVVVVKTKGVHSGDTVEHIRFNVPFNTAKVEFLNADEAGK
ncbi:MAG: hypothetical protein IKS04_05445 [Clostridia bacterium]|nr:hypothetical protein [Clostridia bacterium]